MDSKPYKLSCYLLGHSEDVRALAVFDDGTLVSTSRDKSAIVWTPNSDKNGYTRKTTLEGHSSFVNSVHVINPNPDYPKGCILTGGQDNAICIYEPDCAYPKNKIIAHKGNVCCIRPGHETDTFLSSSWDNSAKLWSLKDLTKPLVTLTKHTAAVWCVLALSKNRIVTGSADKLIIVWQSNGSEITKLSGHTDCVRDLTAINDNEFLSCANDGLVKRWDLNTLQCLDTYSAHSNYIYSIDFNPETMTAVTSGEDYCVKVWKGGEIKETIRLPVQSVWCTKLFKNSDIVTGTCDGILRIFTCDPQRYAEEAELKAYDEAIAVQSQMDNIDINSLSDSSALRQPGKQDGQLIMIREGNKAIAYNWSASKSEWEKIGDVLGQAKPDSKTTGKQMYNGVEYDYVFSVDIEDGAPPLKLPYNAGQDPYVVAQKFIHDNNLDQMFLEQVANFIIRNSNSTPVANTNSSYADPFTGGSRYVPHSNATNSRSNTAPVNVTSEKPAVSYIPQRNYLKLEQANISAILDKLKELNVKLPDVTYKVTNTELDLITKILAEKADEMQRKEATLTMKKMLHWPKENLFPVLDVARLFALKPDVNEQMCNEDVIKMIQKHVGSDTLPANQMLAFRFFANSFICAAGESVNIRIKNDILSSILSLKSLGNKHNQIAISTYLLNLTVALNKHGDEMGRINALDVILKILPSFSDQESIFRMLVSIGSMLSIPSKNQNTIIELVQQSETALSTLTTISEKANDQTTDKLVNCSEYIIKLLFQST